MINTVLIDKNTPHDTIEAVKAELAACEVYGLDCETQDENRHDGLNIYNNKNRHVFDHRRTIMTGFSVYAENSDTAYYINLAHADVENRLQESIAQELLNSANDDALCIAHNAPFELVMFKQCLGRTINNIVCTMQMAVSHHGPDEYDLAKFVNTPLPYAFAKMAQDIVIDWSNFERGDKPNAAQQESLGKFIAKESDSAHSYNGFIKSLSYGYNLKRLTKTAFDYTMKTYDEVLSENGAKHMGELTGAQVASYGADDAYWAVQHYRRFFNDMLKNNPPALVAFFKQENPMVYLYADAWREGIRLNLKEVFERQKIERHDMAVLLRSFKKQLDIFLPFSMNPHVKLMQKEAWYDKNWAKKRADIVQWVQSPDSDDDFEQCFQVSNPIGNGWAAELGKGVPQGKLNLNYWQTMRTIMYDLLELPIQYDRGAVASDKEARGRIRLKLDDPVKSKVMETIHKMAEIEQRMKLYLTPYTLLMDPDTSRVYPSLSSQLATRRLATSFPNPMQLAKLGESAYIRGFYLADDDDSVVVSADWSAIELVLIGEMSSDDGFRAVYGQLPYGDMHSGAAVDGLSVKTLPGLTETEFKEFKYGRNPNKRELVDFAGKKLSPSDYHKWARGTPVGKGINFSYWYSGALSTVANNLGWTDKEHWEAVDKYRARFPGAEAWRIGVHDFAATNGYVVLPDGQRRNRFEATREWARLMKDKFIDITAAQGMQNYADYAIRRLQGRARNQSVNAVIQGTCATLAKRTLLNLIPLLAEADIPTGLGGVRLMMPIHDELVFSVPRRYVLQFIPLLRRAMTEHEDIVSTLPLNCTVAIGRTFRPFNKAEPKLTQIELDEASPIEGVIGKEYEGKALNENQIQHLVDWMFT